MTENHKTVLIIGAAGGLAQILIEIILNKRSDLSIIGIDSRSLSNVKKHPKLTLLQLPYTRGNFERIFRETKIDYVFHLARLSHSSMLNENLTKRLELSVMGTNRILELSERFDIKKLVILSTFHVYGAYPDNSIFLGENSPLRASIEHAELRDVVEMDQTCTSWMWRNQSKLETVLLRPCNIIGGRINNTMTQFLASKFAIKPIDYNPMFQFIHEFDMANILFRALESVPTGVYNIATDDFMSLSQALSIMKNSGIPFPMVLGKPINGLLKHLGMSVPNYLIDYLKFSCLIDNSKIKEVLGEDFYRYTIAETLKLSKPA